MPHFETKAKIELELKNSGIPHAVVAPVAFYDNFTRKHSWTNFGGMGFFEAALEGRALQMVAVDDIGECLANVLLTSGFRLSELTRGFLPEPGR